MINKRIEAPAVNPAIDTESVFAFDKSRFVEDSLSQPRDSALKAESCLTEGQVVRTTLSVSIAQVLKQLTVIYVFHQQ